MFGLIYTLEKIVSLIFDDNHIFDDEEILQFEDIFYPVSIHTTPLSQLLGEKGSGIYFIRYPKGEVYVGSTHNFVNRRSQHLYEMRNGHSNPGIAKLFSQTTLDEVNFTRLIVGAPRETLYRMEQELYGILQERGSLLNVGLDVKAAFKGRPLAPSTQRAAAEANRLLPPHPNRIKAVKEKWKDEEFRKQHREAMRKLWEEGDYRERQRSMRLGVKHEHGGKISKALKGGIKKNSRSVSVNGVVYPTINHAVEASGIKGGTLRRWLDSKDPKYKDYFFV